MSFVAAVLVLVFAFSSPTIADGTVHTDSQCLASAIHYEASGEPLAGKRAVYEVIRNRAVESGSSICGVVTAKGQFSWYGYKPILPYTKEMQQLLSTVRNHAKILNNEKWFFSKYIKVPTWARQMKCRVIGNHKFCREKEDEVQ